MNKAIYINGNFLSDTLTGSERYAIEIVKRLDLAVPQSGLEIFILLPSLAAVTPQELNFHNIQILYLPANKKGRISLFALWRFLRKNKGIYVGFTSNLCLTGNSVTVIYDIRPLTYPSSEKFFQTVRFFLINFCNAYYAKKIVTVSEFSKRQIISVIARGAKQSKIKVISSGYEHILSIENDNAIFDKFPQIKKGEYFYTLGSITPHKNLEFVQAAAEKNSNMQFVVAGKTWERTILKKWTSNVVLVGRISDGESKALMQNCKALLFPSKFEGFGIPPLEALACGAKVLCSNFTCLPEIFENCVAYFDPRFSINLEKLLAEPVSPPQKLLEKYSWDKSAKQWLELLKSMEVK